MDELLKKIAIIEEMLTDLKIHIAMIYTKNLPKKQRELILHLANGSHPREIARIMGVTPEAAYKQIKRMKSRLGAVFPLAIQAFRKMEK